MDSIKKLLFQKVLNPLNIWSYLNICLNWYIFDFSSSMKPDFYFLKVEFSVKIPKISFDKVWFSKFSNPPSHFALQTEQTSFERNCNYFHHSSFLRNFKIVCWSKPHRVKNVDVICSTFYWKYISVWVDPRQLYCKLRIVWSLMIYKYILY